MVSPGISLEQDVGALKKQGIVQLNSEAIEAKRLKNKL